MMDELKQQITIVWTAAEAWFNNQELMALQQIIDLAKKAKEDG